MRAGWVGASLLAIVVIAALVPLVALRPGSGAASSIPVVVVVPFYNETGRPELAPVAAAVGDAAVARLAAPERLGVLSVIGNAPALRRPFAREDVQGIAQQLGGQWVVIGQLKSDGQGLRVIGHLIRAADMKHVWASTFDRPSLTLDAQAGVAESIAQAVSHAVATR
jgi:adenylate cyclase